jgi:hypothetical protein
MARLISLRRFRRSRVSGVGAACLMVLIVLPFTAPFASIDLADLLGGGRAVGEAMWSASEMKDVTDVPIVAAPFSPHLCSETFLDAPLSRVVRLGALRTIVLRI